MIAADGTAVFDQILLNHRVTETVTTSATRHLNPVTDLPIAAATAHSQGFDFN